MKDQKIIKCPHCGSNKGLFVRFRMINCVDYYTFDGNFQSQDLDNADYQVDRKMYCQHCEKYVMKFKEYQEKYLKQ